MPIETATPAATSTKTEPKTSDLAAAAAAGQSRGAAAPPPAAVAPGAGGAPDAAAQKAAADKASADAAAAGKGPSWHPKDEGAKPADEAAKAAEAKAADEKKAAEAAAAAPAAKDPTKYEIKAPEGVKVDAALLEKYRGFAKTAGLSQEQMQACYDRDFATQKAGEEAVRNEMRTTDERWGKELVTSWGPQAAENDALAKRGWDAVDPTGAVRKGLKEVGLLNWPVATNAMVEFARSNLKEDSLAALSVGKSAKTPLPPEEAFAQGYKDRANKKGAK